MPWDLRDLETRLLIGSTLVEGSTLTEAEARQVFAGRAVSGHPVSELRELIGYRAAVQWLTAALTASPYLSLDLVLGFHRVLMHGLSDEAGRFKSHANFSYRSDGSKHQYLSPTEVPPALRAWLEDFNARQVRNPSADAARLYYRFEHIHPFADGNGRIDRVLVAYWLHHKARMQFSFYAEDRVPHLEALEKANEGRMTSLQRFFRMRTKRIR